MVARVLVTGGTGFIGSHICDELIELGHEVVCLDNLLTSSIGNIEHLIGLDGFDFVEADIRDCDSIGVAIQDCTHVTHQAALGSVPRSIEDPSKTNEINLVGGLNLLIKAKESGVSRFVFASSSSVYGDDPVLPKVEGRTGGPLSPYAVSKSAFESYARVFHHVHGMETIGLRYFNVFGPRQSPDGPYAAVIPKFMQSILTDTPPIIFGDGEQTRDFTYVENVVNANILALFGEPSEAYGKCFNVACGESVSINRLFELMRDKYSELTESTTNLSPIHTPDRVGDVRDSLADLSLIGHSMGYDPKIQVAEGIHKTVSWYLAN